MQQLKTINDSAYFDDSKFLKDFAGDLESYLNSHNPDLNGSSCNLEIVKIRLDSTRQINFKNESSVAHSLPIRNLPLVLTSEDKFHIRTIISDLCSKYGITTKKPRITPLSSDVIEGVIKLDREAWDKWVNRHYTKWCKYANEVLQIERDKDLPTILEAEDIVDIALMELYHQLSREIPCNNNPYNKISMLIKRFIDRACHGSHIKGCTTRHESDDDLTKATLYERSKDTQLGSNILEDIKQEHIELMLQEARPRLNSRLAAALDTILNHHYEKGSYSDTFDYLSLDQIKEGIALKTKCKPMSREGARRLLTVNGQCLVNKLKTALSKLASQNPEMKDLAEHVKYLTKSRSF